MSLLGTIAQSSEKPYRGDLDGEKVVKAASKADCVLALNGESRSLLPKRFNA